MNYKLRTNKGFTLIELVVAIALLSMVLGFSSVIFKTSIEAHRTAGANSEIMQKLRAITDQLNRDFKGIQKDAPMAIWFQQDTGVAEPNRYDQIMFFANGDFQAVKYPVFGNVARVYYGQAHSRDSQDDIMKDPFYLLERDRTLARRQHILTADSGIPAWFDPIDFTNFNNLVFFVYRNNDFYEHDRISLAQWRTVDRTIYISQIIPACFDFRPSIDTSDPNTFHNLVCDGVSSFAIQMAYLDSNSVWQWWPYSSDFILPLDTDADGAFGFFFNIPGGVASFNDWHDRSGNWPKALKFTFMLYDSKGIIKNGRTFTHIVYLE